jgi:hypothetical protein
MLMWAISCLPIFSQNWTESDQKSRIEMITTSFLLLKSPEVHSDVTLVILRVLGDLPSFYENAPRDTMSLDLAITILNGLTGFISSLLSDVSLHTTPAPVGRPTVSTVHSRQTTPKQPRYGVKTSHTEQHSIFQKRRVYHLLDCAFYSIFEWISRIFDYRFVATRSGQTVLNKIQEVCVLSLQNLPSYFPNQTNYYEKGLYFQSARVINYLLSRSGQYPLNPTGSASIESQIYHGKSSDLLSTQFQDEYNFSHFLIDNETIISVREISSSSQFSLLVITRNQFGKYIHEISSLASLESHLESSEFPPLDRVIEVLSTSSSPPDSTDGLFSAIKTAQTNHDLISIQKNELNDWLLFSGDHSTPSLSLTAIQRQLKTPLALTSSWSNPFVARLRKQEELERNYPTNPPESMECSPQFPQDSVLSSVSPNHSFKLLIKARHFLSQNRFISPHCHGQVLSIQNTKNFYEKLKALDDCSTREQFEVWIAYAKNENCTKDDRLYQSIEVVRDKNKSEYNPNYLHFLEGLGWIVDLSTHTGEMNL